MEAYMTNGTLSFLTKLAEKHPKIHFYFMENNSSTLVYYEGTKKRIFTAGRQFRAIDYRGDISESGFVMMEHIPVAPDSKPIFENSFSKVKQNITDSNGFQALRFLKPRKGNIYIILVQWVQQSDFEEWVDQRPEMTVKSPAYFADKRFTTNYHMVEEDEENEVDKE